ncbi:MAG: tetratricopeptide repeat protein [Sedimentisphaerales bacterium]
MKGVKLNWGVSLLLILFSAISNGENSPTFGRVGGDVSITYGVNEEALNRYAESIWIPKLDEMTFTERQTSEQIIGLISNADINKAEALLTSFHAHSVQASEFKSRYYTSVYLSNKKYEESLESVLERYKGLPLNDVRYRLDIAYITYFMRLDKGLDYAEQVIKKLKRKYNRPDLSYVWMGVHPTPLVRIIEKNLYPYQDVHPKQQEILRYVINKYPTDQFIDHALYILHDYDEIIRNHPYSMLREEAYYAKAYRKYYRLIYPAEIGGLKESDMQKQVQLAEEVLKDYYTYLYMYENGGYLQDVLRNMPFAIMYLKDSDRVIQELHRLINAIDKLINRHFLDKDYFITNKSIAESIENYLSKSNISDLELWLSHLPDKVLKAINVNDVYIAWARRAFMNMHYIESLNYYNLVNASMPGFDDNEKSIVKELRQVVQLALEVTDHKITEPDYLLQTALALKRTKYYSNQAILYLEKYSNKFKNQNSARIEMLKAFCYRDIHDGKNMVESYRKVVDEYPTDIMAVDALAEIGVYYLLWSYDPEKARNLLNQVVSRYPSGNAKDNALNWIAWSYVREGKLNEALSAYLNLVKNVPLSRFVDYAFRNILKIGIEADLAGPLLQTYFKNSHRKEAAGYILLNDRPAIFYGNIEGRLVKLDVNFDVYTTITNLSFQAGDNYVVFDAEDYKYVVRYAWRVTDKKLFFVAYNKETKVISRSKNYRLLKDEKVVNRLKFHG